MKYFEFRYKNKLIVSLSSIMLIILQCVFYITGCNLFTFWHNFDRVLNLKVNRYRNIWNSQLFLQIKWCSPHVPQHLFPIIRCAHRFVNYTLFHSITLVVYGGFKLPAHKMIFMYITTYDQCLATIFEQVLF